MSRGVVSVIYIPWSPSYARRRPLSDRYKYTRYIYKYEYNKNGILQRQIHRYKYTNTKSVDTHFMKEEAFWVVGEGRKENLVGGIYERPTCILSMRRPWPTLGVKNWGVTWRI